MVNVAVVGATGLVGQKMLQVLEERNFPVKTLFPVASSRSAGKTVTFKGNNYTVEDIETFDLSKAQVALFSAGGVTSRKWAPKFADAGCRVIDNSSAWRMDPTVPLVVPEVNPAALNEADMIIANPNCSTIQMVVALKPLDDTFNLRKVIVSTYQSVTGAGYKGLQQLENEIAGIQNEPKHFAHQIAYNCLPHIDVFDKTGYTREELKMIDETRKIMNLPGLPVTPTTVRVAVRAGHSESVYAEFEQEIDLDKVLSVLSAFPGITVQDDPQNNIYPTPLTADDKDDVFVGRIRADLFNPHVLNFWVVSDNLRKGAATNAVQIAELVLEKGFLP